MAEKTISKAVENEKKEIEIVNPILLDWDDREYTLDFNRDTASALQYAGFDADKIATHTLIYPEQLFNYAFKMHHPNVNRRHIESMWRSLDGEDRADIVSELLKLYYQTINATWEGDGGEKKAKWRRKG